LAVPVQLRHAFLDANGNTAPDQIVAPWRAAGFLHSIDLSDAPAIKEAPKAYSIEPERYNLRSSRRRRRGPLAGGAETPADFPSARSDLSVHGRPWRSDARYFDFNPDNAQPICTGSVTP